MASFFHPAGFGGGVLDLRKLFRRQAIVRAVLLSRLQASLRATAAPKWHPDSYSQPGETE